MVEGCGSAVVAQFHTKALNGTSTRFSLCDPRKAGLNSIKHQYMYEEVTLKK